MVNVDDILENVTPKDVTKEMQKLLKNYNNGKAKNLTEILDIHYHFETIHPFQDGNGRVGRLIMFKEFLKTILYLS